MRAAVGYIRVSTQEQVENGQGLGIQRDAIAGYAQAHDLQLTEVFADEGQSGSNGLESRLGLADLMASAEQGDIQAVVVARLDRLARDLALQETLIAKMQKMGVEFVSIAEPDLCSDDPGRVMMRQILGAIAQYERKLIAARLNAGRKRKKMGGGYQGGWVPLGYRVEGVGREAVVLVDEQTAPTVRRIFAERAAGATMQAIAQGLNADEVPTVRGGQWARATVSTILRCKAYLGEEYPAIAEVV